MCYKIISRNTFGYNSFLNPLVLTLPKLSSSQEKDQCLRDRQHLLWAARFITLVFTLLAPDQGPLHLANIPHSFQPFCVYVKFLPATGFPTKNDVKTAHLNKQMETSIFSNCLTGSSHIDTTEMKFLISKHCFISLTVKSNTKHNFFTKEKNINYGLKLIKCQYWFTN